MNKLTLFKLFVVVILLASFSPATVVSTSGSVAETVAETQVNQVTPPPPVTAKAAVAQDAAQGADVRRGPSGEDALDKLHPSLRDLVEMSAPALPGDQGGGGAAAPADPVLVSIIASVDRKEGVESTLVERLRPYFVDDALYGQPPLGEKKGLALQVLFGRIRPGNLAKVASFGNVLYIYPIEAEKAQYEPYPPDDTRPQSTPTPDDWARLRANAASRREGTLPWDQAKVYGDGLDRLLTSPTDWFEVMPEGPHKAKGAWDRGYTGEGVVVAVDDDGVDFAHPDLMGTQKIYSGTWSLLPSLPSPYNGWPYAFDPFTMRAYAYDLLLGTSYIAGAFGGTTYVDTSATPELTPCGSGISCFEYAPLIDFNTPGYKHTYVIADAMSKSGVVHVGTHHDESLRDYVWGERVAVLVCDPNTAGVYDTVYVDLDDDYDFRDEKPLTKADPTNPVTYNNPVSYRDMSVPPDGIADLSGGLLYFIADGVNFIPGSDWLWGGLIPPPGNGDLIALHGPWDSGYSHGTTCASEVVAQGVIDGMLPEFRDLAPGPGKPAAAAYGMAPGAKLVAMNDGWTFTGRANVIDGYFFLALGWDGIDQTGFNFFYGPGFEDSDTIVASSHSYGWSGDFNDGYDYLGQIITELQRNWAPYAQFFFSTGNGGPGYGTVAPPSPALGIAVGASSEYGSTGWDTITDTDQINFNDVAPLSNSGPGARDGAGVDVVAGGAYAAGVEELNYYSPSMYGILDGNVSWDDWGGTSRSGPVALGIYALAAQAYKDAHGAWPTYDQGKALLMSSATDLNYDVYKQGAGSVNGDRVTQVASGEYGVYMDAGSASWEPGDYRGTDYPAFAHIVYPGDTWNKTFTVANDGPNTVTVQISDAYLERIGTQEIDFTVTPTMTQQESAYGPENRDNFYKAFNYFIPITAEVGMDVSWYNVDIPPDADLMVVRQIFPFDEYDVDGDYNWDNRFYLVVYNWKDQDGDGLVWVDKDGNDVVNFINGPYLDTDGLKASPELAWDDARTELDRWEYGRFGYNRPSANVNAISIHDPLERMHDGLFIGLRHLYNDVGSGQTVHLKYRFEFYKEADVGWLSTDVGALDVPAGGTAAFTGTVNVPGDMPVGDYAAAVEVVDPGLLGGEAHTTVIPVAINVAADFDGDVTLGGVESYAYDADQTYNNGALRGYFDWGWREESGDWRFFYMDFADVARDGAILWSEDFDDGIPSDWTVVDNAEAGGAVWDDVAGSGEAGNWAGTGDAASASSDVNPGPFDTELWSPPFDLPYGDLAILLYTANFQDMGGADYLDLDISPDGGANWINLLSWNEDHGGFRAPDSGEVVLVDLADYRGKSGLILRWCYYSPVGTWDWYAQIDDVIVVIPEHDNAVVKDVWDDAAPHTDIDTIVLGPSASGMDWVESGGWIFDLSEPAYYGPYVLDVIASSPDDRADRSVWRFNTSSGGNEDWVSFPLYNGGLHEFLQHNVLFEGDKFDVVFTKTVGVLYEDVHALDIDSYIDAGVLGAVTVTPTVGLNSLQTEGYLIGVDTYDFVNQPVGFAGSGSIEWTYVFTVENGVSIEMWSDSVDISDIDLFLFRWNGSTWQQRAYSAGASAEEHIFYLDPPDGRWMAGINNYSGPAGNVDLAIEVKNKVPGSIWATGATTDPVAADTPVELTVHYDYPMIAGRCYDGVLYAGPAEAPRLKEILITICRQPNSAYIEKTADRETVYPLMEYDYTVDLYNFSDALAQFQFSDPIPDSTEFVTASSTCGVAYDAVLDQVVYSGTLPVTASGVPQDEGFEGGVMPPAGWAVKHLGDPGCNQWFAGTGAAHSGSYAALISYDAANNQDEWLYSPWFAVSEDAASFWAISDTVYPGATVKVWAVKPNGSMDLLWDMLADEMWNTFEYRQVTLDVSAYAGQRIQLAWQYVGLDGEGFGLDDVHLAGTPLPAPSCSLQVTVRVTDTVTGGTYITNTATLLASHFDGAQVEPTASASAVTVVGEAYPWITKSVDYDVTFPGNELVYTIVLANYLHPATFSMKDSIPDNTEFVTMTANATYDATHDRILFDGVVTDTHTITLTVRVTDTLAVGTVITNVATVGSALFTGEQSATAVSRIGGADLSTSYKEATSFVMPGEHIAYDIHVKNAGAMLASVTLTDTIPANTTFVDLDDSPPTQHFAYNAAENQVEWTGSVAPGAELVFSFWVQADTGLMHGDAVTNTAVIIWEDGAADLQAVTVVNYPDLEISKSGPATAMSGETITYTLVYTNASNVAATGVVITDTLPSGVTSAITPTWQIGDVGAGVTGTLTFNATVGDVCGPLTNRVEIAGAEYDPDASDDEAQAVTAVTCYVYLPLTAKNYGAASDVMVKPLLRFSK